MPHSNNRDSLGLAVETLEPRMMLSTVTINAVGDTGEEMIELRISGELAETYNVGTEVTAFTYQTEQSLSADDVSIHFINDLYAPDQGIDRNVTIPSIEIDGQVYETDSRNVFSFGVWDPDQQRIVDGLGLGDTLHANGFFEYSEVDQSSQINFAGRTWSVVEGLDFDNELSVSADGTLTMRGHNGPVAISTQFEVNQSDALQFAVVAERPILEGSFTSDSQPWATAGINFYDDNGNLLDQLTRDINTSIADLIGPNEVIPPANATSGFAWLWIDRFDPGVDMPLVVQSFEIDGLDFADDSEPPTVTLNPFSFTRPGQTTVNFGVTFVDNVRLGVIPSNSLVITGPNGFELTPAIAIGAPGNTATFQTLVFTFTRPGGGEFDSDNNGTYTVTLQPDRVRDFAGNFAEGRVLGTFEIDIA